MESHAYLKVLRMQCWEYYDCGREPGGDKADELGICPAAIDASYDGVNNGTNAGRCCWRVAGTLCGGDVQGTFAAKYKTCLECRFYEIVRHAEGDGFKLHKDTGCMLATVTARPDVHQE